MRFVLFLLFGVALAGCGRETLDLGYEGDDASYELAQEAAGMWNEACRGRLVVVHRGLGGVPLIAVPNSLGFPGRQIASTHTIDDVPVSIEFDETQPTPLVLAALAHEMGHAMGLEHTEEGLMRSPMDPRTDFFITPHNCRDVK